jgi:hypothetical protein
MGAACGLGGVRQRHCSPRSQRSPTRVVNSISVVGSGILAPRRIRQNRRQIIESLTSQHGCEVHTRPVAPATTGWTCRSEHPGMLAARTCEPVWLGAVTSRRG